MLIPGLNLRCVLEDIQVRQCVPETYASQQASIIRAIGRYGQHRADSDIPAYVIARDEVLGLHPVPEIDAAALKRQPGLEDLALSCQLKKRGSEMIPAGGLSSSVYLGRVALAYPAGFAEEIMAFWRGIYLMRNATYKGLDFTRPAL